MSTGAFTPTPGERYASSRLDLAHPFEKVLLEMAALSRRKRADYAVDGSPFSNFYETAEEMRRRGKEGFTALDSVTFNRVQKQVRLNALTANGRLDDTANESVRDTLLDDAVYAVISLAVYDEMHAAEPTEEREEEEPSSGESMQWRGTRESAVSILSWAAQKGFNLDTISLKGDEAGAFYLEVEGDVVHEGDWVVIHPELGMMVRAG